MVWTPLKFSSLLFFPLRVEVLPPILRLHTRYPLYYLLPPPTRPQCPWPQPPPTPMMSQLLLRGAVHPSKTNRCSTRQISVHRISAQAAVLRCWLNFLLDARAPCLLRLQKHCCPRRPRQRCRLWTHRPYRLPRVSPVHATPCQVRLSPPLKLSVLLRLPDFMVRDDISPVANHTALSIVFVSVLVLPIPCPVISTPTASSAAVARPPLASAQLATAPSQFPARQTCSAPSRGSAPLLNILRRTTRSSPERPVIYVPARVSAPDNEARTRATRVLSPGFVAKLLARHPGLAQFTIVPTRAQARSAAAARSRG